MSRTVATYVSCETIFVFATVTLPLRDRWYGRQVRMIPSIFSFTILKFESVLVMVFSREKPKRLKLSVHLKPSSLQIVSLWLVFIFSTLQDRPLMVWKSVRYFFCKDQVVFCSLEDDSSVISKGFAMALLFRKLDAS